MKTINFNNEEYLKFQSEGNAAQFVIPFAKHICIGNGIDIGCGKLDWMFPGAKPVDPNINNYTATNFPYNDLDYIFSSHCLEHLNDWVGVLDHWYEKLKVGGVLFLYLPDYSQEYWRPWNNRKHINILSPEFLEDYFIYKNFKSIFVSGIDLNNSFTIVGKK